jgi:hypothetical protein
MFESTQSQRRLDASGSGASLAKDCWQPVSASAATSMVLFGGGLAEAAAGAIAVGVAQPLVDRLGETGGPQQSAHWRTSRVSSPACESRSERPRPTGAGTRRFGDHVS